MRKVKFAVLALNIFSALCLGAHSASATEIDPAQFCKDNSECSAPMRAISAAYAKAGTEFTKKDFSGFSGECFHLNEMYDPTHAHHGAFVFWKHDQGFLASGLFSFFSDSDPYAGLSVAALTDRVTEGGSALTPVIAQPDHLELAFVTEKSDMRYWFRSDKQQTHLWVIGRQAAAGSSASLLFCQMLSH